MKTILKSRSHVTLEEDPQAPFLKEALQEPTDNRAGGDYVDAAA